MKMVWVNGVQCEMCSVKPVALVSQFYGREMAFPYPVPRKAVREWGNLDLRCFFCGGRMVALTEPVDVR